MVWYSHFFPNFPQFVVIHTVKGFGVVNKAEEDVTEINNKAEVDAPHLRNLLSSSSGPSMSLPIFVNNDPSFLLQNVLESS